MSTFICTYRSIHIDQSSGDVGVAEINTYMQVVFVVL